MKSPKKSALEGLYILLLLFVLALAHPSLRTLSAQENEPARNPAQGPATASFDKTFPDGDSIRNIIEPVFVGETAFAQRLNSRTTLSAAQDSPSNAHTSVHTPLGLVLSGGSARAYAHIGVLKELEKAGIYPDFIVANSMGAIIGLLYAAGFSPDDIQLLIHAIPLDSYFDIVLPTHGGFINTEAFSSAIRMLVGNLDISETAIPIIVTAEDLLSRRQIWFAEGQFDRIITAAFSIPAVFEPQPIDNFMLIDGGIAAVVPLEPAQRFTDRLIVSTALYNRAMSYSNPLTVINRAIDIGKTRTSMSALEKTSAFIIRNNVETLSYMQFSDPDLIIAKGQESAAKAIAALDAQERTQLENPPPPSLAELRNRMHQKLVKTIEALRAGALPASVPTLRAAPVLRLFPPISGFTGETETIPRAGLSAVFSAWKARTSLSYFAAIAPETDKQWALDGSININPIGTFVIGASARLWGDYDNTALLGHIPAMWEFAGSLKSAAFVGAAKIGFAASADVIREIGTASTTWQSIGLVSAASATPGFDQGTHTIVPWYSLEAGGFAENTAGAKLSAGLEGTLMMGLHAGLFSPRIRGSAKVALNGNAFLGPKFDGFRGSAIRSTEESLLITNAELAIIPRSLFFDIAETALVRNLELAPFFDTEWSAPAGGAGSFAMRDWAAGLSVSFEASAFGLAPVTISTYASYSGSHIFTFQVRAGALFPSR